MYNTNQICFVELRGFEKFTEYRAYLAQEILMMI